MAALRDNTALMRARRRYRQRRHRRVEVHRVVVPPAKVKQTKRRHTLGRLGIALLLSLGVHTLVVLLAPKPKPPKPADYGSKGYIEITQLNKGPKETRAPVVKNQHDRVVPTKKRHEETETPPVADVQPYEAEHGDSSSTPGITIPSAPSPGGGPSKEELKKMDLFNKDALGNATSRWKSSLPSADQFTKPDSIGDGNDPAAEQARVNSRLQGQISQANKEGMVAGGLISSCNDGIDQGLDGFMDCADEGCRMLPACANTKEFKNNMPKDIPDGDVRGITSMVDVNDDDSGKIRALTMKVDVMHRSPGDLALEIEHNGHKQVVRLADRGNHFWEMAYLLQDFIGSDARGKWTIRIRDVFPGESGTLKGWTLYVTREVRD